MTWILTYIFVAILSTIGSFIIYNVHENKKELKFESEYAILGIFWPITIHIFFFLYVIYRLEDMKIKNPFYKEMDD